MIEDSKNCPEWTRKIEEDIGQNIAYMTCGFDESVRDNLVAKSDLFNRFVRYHIQFNLYLLGLGEAKVL